MGTIYSRRQELEFCDEFGFNTPIDRGIKKHHIADIVLGIIYSIALVWLFTHECRSKKFAKIMNQFSHTSGDLKRFYHWGWAVMILALITNVGQVLVILGYNAGGLNCESNVTEIINQTTGVSAISVKFCSYTTQIYRLKSFFGGSKDTNKLAYPTWIFYVCLIIVWGNMIFYDFYWYMLIFYCGNCTPIGLLMPGNMWFLPGLFIMDIFWFVLLSILFGIKIHQLSNIVREQDGDTQESILVRTRLNRSMQSVLVVGFIANGTSVTLYSIGYKIPSVLGEFALTDVTINSFCTNILFEHNQIWLRQFYIYFVGRIFCCWNKAKRNQIDMEMSFDPRNNNGNTKVDSKTNDATHDDITTNNDDLL